MNIDLLPENISSGCNGRPGLTQQTDDQMICIFQFEW